MQSGDLESLSHRTATEFNPDDREDFQEDRAWHYRAEVDRKDGQLLPLMISIRLPHTDLDEVVAAAGRRPGNSRLRRENTSRPPAPSLYYRTRRRCPLSSRAFKRFQSIYRTKPRNPGPRCGQQLPYPCAASTF